MKLSTISSFKAGSTIRGFYICKEKSHRNTKNGDSYLDLILQDKTGKISAKIWDEVSHFDDLFEASEPVAVKGKVEDYNSRLQLVVQQIKKAEDKTYQKYGFSLSQLIEKVEEPIDELWTYLQNAVKSLKNPYKKIITLILKKYEAEIKIIPASINHHHPISGGFLKHITSMIDGAISLLKNYKDLNNDLIISGIILHDIGKVSADDPETPHEPHSHPGQEEIIWVLSGEGYTETHGVKMELRAGLVAYIPSGMEHKTAAVGGKMTAIIMKSPVKNSSGVAS